MTTPLTEKVKVYNKAGQLAVEGQVETWQVPPPYILWQGRVFKFFQFCPDWLEYSECDVYSLIETPDEN